MNYQHNVPYDECWYCTYVWCDDLSPFSPDNTTGASSGCGINLGDNRIGLCEGEWVVYNVVNSGLVQEVDFIGSSAADYFF